MTNVAKPVCLTIAGLDPSGGAGVIADVKTFAAFGCFATAAVTSVLLFDLHRAMTLSTSTL
jgi:hydroxymethylpyrimidine/phosphomethylpyrimidine kinase